MVGVLRKGTANDDIASSVTLRRGTHALKSGPPMTTSRHAFRYTEAWYAYGERPSSLRSIWAEVEAKHVMRNGHPVLTTSRGRSGFLSSKYISISYLYTTLVVLIVYRTQPPDNKWTFMFPNFV